MYYKYEEFDKDGHYVFRSPRKQGRPMGPGNPHLPNKAERKLLTNMMKAGGLTEEQVRAIKGNRQKLSAAAKSMSQPKGNIDIETKRLRRKIVHMTDLKHYDPKIDKIIRECRHNSNIIDIINKHIKENVE